MSDMISPIFHNGISLMEFLKLDNVPVFQRFDRDGIELVINPQTGESFATQAGYARMSGIEYSTIRKRSERSKGSDNISQKTAEIPTPGGIQEVTLVTEDQIAEWLPKDNPSMASKLLKLGVRMFMHELAGFKFQPQQAAQPKALNWKEEIAALSLDGLQQYLSPRAMDKLIMAEINQISSQSTDGISSHLLKINALALRIGTLTPRIVKKYRLANSVDEAVSYFQKLEALGYGTIEKGRTLKYSTKTILA